MLLNIKFELLEFNELFALLFSQILPLLPEVLIVLDVLEEQWVVNVALPRQSTKLPPTHQV